MNRHILITISFVSISFVVVADAADLRTVALTGQQAPGAPAASPTKVLVRFSKGTSCITVPC